MSQSNVFWTSEQAALLKKHRNDSWEELEKLFGKSWDSLRTAMRKFSIHRDRKDLPPLKYNDEAFRVIVDGFTESQKYRRYAPEDRSAINALKDDVMKRVVKTLKSGKRVTWEGVRTAAQQLRSEDLKRIGREKVPLPLIWTNCESVSAKEKAVIAPPVPARHWPGPVELAMDAKKFSVPGYRVGFASRIDWKSLGFREAEVFRGAEIFCAKGCQFFVINAGLVHKKWVNGFVGEYTAGLPKDARIDAQDAALQEIARGLAFAIPRVPHPMEKGKFIKWYITPSNQHDGKYGDAIAQKLQALRSDDIRVHDPRKGPLMVKVIDKRIGVVNMLGEAGRSRMPSKYHSNAAERDIEDFETLTARDDYDIYAVGGHASCVHNPRGGERKTPYFTIPALHRLQGDRVAENQEGVVVLEWVSDGSAYSVRTFPLRDWSHGERMCITGIKEGAKSIHQKIVDVIKRIGAVTVGVLEEELKIPRDILGREIQFLLEPKRSPRKTWPGLYYDPASQTYDFHPEWIQETLRYPKLQKESIEHRLLKFGCLHAGYRTSDYEYFVKKYPEIIVARGVDTLVGIGDFIAGLHHDFLCTGEVFGGLNNDDQEEFAAELVATVMLTVFAVRFKAEVSMQKPQNAVGVAACIDKALLNFIYTIGNHDNWQLQDGANPLGTFRTTLVAILMECIQKMLATMQLPAVDVAGMVRSKVTLVPQHRPQYRFGSGMVMGLHHPYMGRAKTSSLRAQEELKFLRECHVVGVANFHTSIFAQTWEPSLGQRIVAQVGTMAIGTSFEMGKMKRVDFGPLYVRVRVQNRRIIMTETEAFPDPILVDQIPKGSDPEQLKARLGLVRAR